MKAEGLQGVRASRFRALALDLGRLAAGFRRHAERGSSRGIPRAKSRPLGSRLQARRELQLGPLQQ